MWVALDSCLLVQKLNFGEFANTQYDPHNLPHMLFLVGTVIPCCDDTVQLHKLQPQLIQECDFQKLLSAKQSIYICLNFEKVLQEGVEIQRRTKNVVDRQPKSQTARVSSVELKPEHFCSTESMATTEALYSNVQTIGDMMSEGAFMSTLYFICALL